MSGCGGINGGASAVEIGRRSDELAPPILRNRFGAAPRAQGYGGIRANTFVFYGSVARVRAG